MNRIFFFGCSYTHFAWPTWADLVAVHATGYSIQSPHQRLPNYSHNASYNFGCSGGSNSVIIHRLLAANALYRFTSDDIICVQWTSKFRHTVAAQHSLTDHDRIGYADPQHSVPHCFWQEVVAHKLLHSVAEQTGARLFEIDFDGHEVNQVVESTDLADCLMQTMLSHDSGNPDWHSLAQWDKNTDDWFQKTNHIDAHPSPQEHLSVARSVCELLGLGTINDNAVQHAAQATDMLNYQWDKLPTPPHTDDSDAWQIIVQTVRKSYVAEIHASNSMEITPQESYVFKSLLNPRSSD